MSISFRFFGKTIRLSREHSEKAPSCICSTVSGSSILVKLVQPLNAFVPIILVFFPNITFSNFRLLIKEQSAISTRLFGKLISFKLEKSPRRNFCVVVIPSLIINFFIFDSLTSFPYSIASSVSPFPDITRVSPLITSY